MGDFVFFLLPLESFFNSFHFNYNMSWYGSFKIHRLELAVLPASENLVPFLSLGICQP